MSQRHETWASVHFVLAIGLALLLHGLYIGPNSVALRAGLELCRSA